MRIRYYLDEDAMSTALVRSVRSQGVEVITASDASMTWASDEKHLIYAAENGLTLYSYNIRDYRQLHDSFLEQGHSHAGITLLEQRLRMPTGEQMRRLVRLADTFSAEEMKDQLLFLSAWN